MLNYWPLSLLSFAGGIVLAYYEAWPAMLALFLLLLLAAAGRILNHSKLCLILALMVAGGIYYNLFSLEIPQNLPTQTETHFKGRIEDFPSFDGEKTVFTLRTGNSSAYQKRIRVVCLFPASLKRGDLVSVQGDLKPPREPGNPGEFNFSSYLAHQGIYYNLTIREAADLTAAAPEQGLLYGIDFFRYKGEELTKQVLTPSEAAILLGMILGGREGIEAEQYDDFQKTGIVHLFSVGGLHVGFLLILTAWVSSLLGLSRRFKCGSGMAILLVYGTMVAWPPPVVRAVVMGILGLWAYYSGRENSMVNALAISGFCLLLINPGILFNLSFQLTFLATWALVYLFPLLRKWFPYQGWAWDMVLLPLAAELAVLPFVAYYFNLFTPASILTNILITYLAGAAVILGFMAFLLASFMPSIAALFLYPAGFSIDIILLIVKQVKSLPGGYLWVATPALSNMILYYTSILLFTQSIKDHRYDQWRLPAAVGLIVFILILLTPAGYSQRGQVELVFMDVGQGDAILLKTPQGQFVLLDGGGSQIYDVGANKVLPYLHHRGIRQLAMIINTHPDIDHLKGLESVAAEMPVRYFGLPHSIYNCPEYDNLKTLAARESSPVLSLEDGQMINLEEGLEIKVLYPQGEMYSGTQFNQESVVLQIKYGNFSAVLCGDIPSEFLTVIARKADVPCVIVKVPHHGSKGSLEPEFYKVLQPRYAVISVGEENPFGHPHPAVVKMLAEKGIEVLRTDKQGAIVIASDGAEVTIRATK